MGFGDVDQLAINTIRLLAVSANPSLSCSLTRLNYPAATKICCPAMSRRTLRIIRVGGDAGGARRDTGHSADWVLLGRCHL